MNKEKKALSRIVIYNLIYAAIVIAIGVYALFFTDVFDTSYMQNLRDFSEGWSGPNGLSSNIDEYAAPRPDMKVFFIKNLPDDIRDGDDLCFEATNAYIRVDLDGTELYRFDGEENLTGKGYGTVYHIIGLSPEMSGKRLTINYFIAGAANNGYDISEIYIGPAMDYFHMNLKDNQVSVILTLLIIFFGGLLILMWAGIADKDSFPIDILDFGVGSALIGIWLLACTRVVQLITGTVYEWRILGRMTVILAMYPFVRFFNSTTRLKRKSYEYLAFYLTMGLEVLMILLRFTAGVDVAKSFTVFETIMITLTFVIVLVLLLDNLFYCRRNNIPMEQKGTYLGMAALFICCFTELIVYSISVVSIPFGTFVRLGMLLFILSVLIQFINWWMRDQAAVDRDRFVNRSLQFAVSSKNPEESIRLLLEYMGKELGARRTVIFEDMDNGFFQNTYEWFVEGEVPLPKEQSVVPYEGYIDQIYDRMFLEDRYIEIEDVEKIKTIYPNLYERLKEIGTIGMVASPLKSEGRLIGIFCVGDILPKNLKNITEIMGIISYFFAQFISQRKERERILYYSYHDPLSGTKNRSALKEFTDEKLDMSQAFGYLICEIWGLKAINDRRGHDVGDEIVRVVAKCLMDAFGEDNVYRISGEEFVCYGFESDETYFENDVERARRLLNDAHCSTSIGSVYCSNGTTDLDNVKRYAHRLLERERLKNAD
jgi:diguanylate cyclase (GGDEF)-like protein